MQARKSPPVHGRTKERFTHMNRLISHKEREAGRVPMGGVTLFSEDTQDPCIRSEIISAYLRSLQGLQSPVAQEVNLPYPKYIIRQAIWNELKDNPDSEIRDQLEIAYSQLESFLPQEEYEVLRGFQYACALTREVTKSGNPRDIIASARLLSRCEGNRAVEIQEKISQRMRKRREEIRSIGWLP